MVKKGPEQEFKEKLMQHYRASRYKVTPIQTRTVPGVPDLFVAGQHGSYWIECKQLHKITFRFDHPHIKAYKIPFRPGQQKWALEHFLSTHQKEWVRCYVQFKDGIYGFDQKKVYEDHWVPVEDFYVITGLL